ncbi:MAG: type II toxin-antitoxin system VapC family toxin [Planctomycetia bacterium]|nr:type II toxin-antitoxin system VapC family toxin [Planctomycetia bacterium]
MRERRSPPSNGNWRIGTTTIASSCNYSGHEKARRYLVGGAISAVNYSEVLKKAVERGSDLQLARFHLENFALSVIPFDDRSAVRTAELWSAGRQFGLSFADRACLALGIESKAKVVTGDRRWKDAALGISVIVFR